MTRLWLAVLAAFALSVVADQTVTVDGADLTIRYTTVPDNGGYQNQTWIPVARSANNCDTPQMLTSRLGDYATFTFTGTGLQVVGTKGNKRGRINMSLDGQNTTVDRSNRGLVCDAVLFQASGLVYQQHTIVATLIGEDPDYSSGAYDAVLSIQRIRYTIPGGKSSNVGAIAGGAAGGAVFAILVAFLVFWCIRRKRSKKPGMGHSSRASFDAEDVPPHLQGGSKPLSTVTSPGLIATPFEWKGPEGLYQESQYHQPSEQQYPQRQSATSPTSVSFAPSAYAGVPQSAGYAASTSGPSQSGWDHSQTSGDVKRASGVTGSSGMGFGLSNPEDGGRRESSPPHEAALVDRIANRLADIIHTRAGGAQVLDSIVPPPEYRPQYVTPNEAISNMREQALQERVSTDTPNTMLPYAQQPQSQPNQPYSGSPPPQAGPSAQYRI